MSAEPIPRLTGWRRLCATCFGWDYVAVSDFWTTEPRRVTWMAMVPHCRPIYGLRRLDPDGTIHTDGTEKSWHPLTRRMYVYRYSSPDKKLRAVRNA